MALSTVQDHLDFLPLFPTETEAAILARLVAWANDGLDASSDRWVDTREGGHWRTAVVPCTKEIARLYDLAGTEVIASGLILWTWGTYLDDQAQVMDLLRLPATSAQGTVTFSTLVDVGTPATDITAGTQVGAAPASEDADAPLFQVTVGGTIPAGGGSIDLAVQAVVEESAGNVAADAITVPSTPLPGVTFTNAAPTEGGTDPETDDALRERLLEQFVGAGGGTILDYKRWAGSRAGVGRVTVIPIWNGPDTVLVIVMTADGQPVSAAVVDDVQQFLDPVPGQAHGQAPVGDAVTVKTATLLNIDVTTHVTFEDGYSLDGAGGTIALRDTITAAVSAYVQTVEPAGEVVVAQIEGHIALVPGVHDVAVSAPAANVAVPAGAAPEVPTLHSITFT